MGVIDAITGREILEKVEEFSRIYGEILIGMHSNLEGVREQFERFAREHERLRQEFQELFHENARISTDLDGFTAKFDKRLAEHMQTISKMIDNQQQERIRLQATLADELAKLRKTTKERIEHIQNDLESTKVVYTQQVDRLTNQLNRFGQQIDEQIGSIQKLHAEVQSAITKMHQDIELVKRETEALSLELREQFQHKVRAQILELLELKLLRRLEIVERDMGTTIRTLESKLTETENEAHKHIERIGIVENQLQVQIASLTSLVNAYHRKLTHVMYIAGISLILAVIAISVAMGLAIR